MRPRVETYSSNDPATGAIALLMDKAYEGDKRDNWR